MKAIIPAFLIVTLFAPALFAQAADDWVAEQSANQRPCKYFDEASVSYVNTQSSDHSYDKDPYGMLEPQYGYIRFNFSSNTISISGISKTLPIDITRPRLEQLRLVCQNIIDKTKNHSLYLAPPFS
jgi:hypothetical protein